MARIPSLAALFVLLAISAGAQTPYVVGAISADISRFSHTTSSLYPSSSRAAEVLSGGLRIGTSLGPRWGLELEFVRSGRSRESTPALYPLIAAGAGLPSGFPSPLVTGSLGGISLPVPFDYRAETTRRRMALNPVAWVRQSVGSSVDLVYLAGVAFDRERQEITEIVTPTVRTVVAFPPVRSEFIQYGTHPLVGMEARINLTAKLRLVSGVRVEGLADGWLLRPHVGLGWFFSR